MLLSKINQVRTALEFPLAPWCDDLDIRVQRIGREFKPYLVIALARGPMRNGIGSGFLRNLNQAF